MTQRILRAALLAGASLFVLPASAQDSAPDLIITANKQAQSIQEIGSAVTVIAGDEIEKQGFKSIRDVLQGQPGVSITESGGPGGLTTVRLRGAESSHTLVLVDGVRVNDPTTTGGEIDLSVVAPDSIERIEIVRGPQSALYGSDAIGGVINIITKKGRKGPPVWRLRTEGGSYGTYGARLGVSGATEDTSYAFSFGQFHADGFQRFGYRIPRLAAFDPNGSDPLDRLSGSGKVSRRVNEFLTLEAGFDIARKRFDFDQGYGADPTATNKGRSLLATAYQRAIADNGPFRTTLTTFQTRITRGDDYAVGDTDTYTGVRVGAELQEDINLKQYGKFTIGARYEHEHAKGDYVSFGYGSPFDARQHTAAAYALYQITLFEKLHLSAGGRIDDVSTSGTFNTYRLTAAYDLTSTTRVRASYGTGAKAPSLYQLTAPLYGNPNLDPETSKGFDVGVEQSFLNGDARASVTYFRNDIRNLIDCPGWPCSYINIAEARISGVEIGAEYNLVPSFAKLKAAYTFLDTEDVSTGHELPRRPKHSGRVSVAFTPMPDLTIEPILRVRSNQYDNIYAPYYTKGYARFDLVADYKLNGNVSVFARGENLTNVKYEDVYNYGTAGRSVYAGVQMTW